MNQQITERKSAPSKLESQLDYILLDGSGSMKYTWWESLDAIQAYIDGIKAQNIKSQVIFQVFAGTHPDYIARDVPLDQWKPLRQDPVGSNWGSTPLYDAINLMGRRLRDLDPPRASIVIVTDGEEAGSHFTNLTQAKAILNWMRAKGWQITFIGANFDNSQSAALLGGDKNSAIGVNIERLADATAALAKKRGRYSLYGTPMHWSDDEQQNFGGYLGGPSNA